MTPPPRLRAGRDEDAADFIALIGACWAEYPGNVLDVDGEVPELRALATYYAKQGGALWAADHDGRVAGMVGTRPLGDGAWEICKMYTDAALRGAGLAQLLIGAAEDFARSRGATRMKLWSDTRFDRAHRFYEKQSYVRSGALKVHNDLSNSIEFAYAKPLAGVAVERLDAAWAEGVLAGTVMLDLDMPPNQPHRAEVQKLLVHPEARRRGLARALMAAVEAEARAAGRALLVLDTREGDAAEALYRASSWHAVGRIPEFAQNAAGTREATVLFWKKV